MNGFSLAGHGHANNINCANGTSPILEPLEHRRLLSVAPAARSVARAALATPIANIATFADGNGSTTPDQYPGISGDGWLQPWQSSTPAVQAKVFSGKVPSQPNPLDQVQPQFLQVTTAGDTAVSRGFAGTAGITSRVIQFDYRFEGTSNGNNANDDITLFGDNDPIPQFTSTAVATTYTWAIKAYMNAAGAVWEFGGRISGQGIVFSDNVAAGVTVHQGDVYQFTINEHFHDGIGSYIAVVRDTTDGAVYAMPSAARLCADPTSTDHIDFGMSLASGEIGRFSLDAVHIATVAAAPVVFVIGGYGVPQNPSPGNPSVAQDFGPALASAGINTTNFRYYEENYDNDTKINSHGDTIAKEIDNVPASTPVVVIGFSFGGGEAVKSAEQADRTVNDLTLFDPVLQTDYYNQVDHTSSNPALDHPTQIVQKLTPNIKYAVDFSRLIFSSNDKLYPTGPYGFLISGQPRTFENLFFPRTTDHNYGLITPRPSTPAPGPSGDPINDAAETIDDVLDGFSPFWDGVP